MVFNSEKKVLQASAVKANAIMTGAGCVIVTGTVVCADKCVEQ